MEGVTVSVDDASWNFNTLKVGNSACKSFVEADIVVEGDCDGVGSAGEVVIGVEAAGEIDCDSTGVAVWDGVREGAVVGIGSRLVELVDSGSGEDVEALGVGEVSVVIGNGVKEVVWISVETGEACVETAIWAAAGLVFDFTEDESNIK